MWSLLSYSLRACFWSLRVAHCLAGKEIQVHEGRQAVGIRSAHGLLFLKPWERSRGFFCFTVITSSHGILSFESLKGRDDNIREVGIEKTNRGTDFF